MNFRFEGLSFRTRLQENHLEEIFKLNARHLSCSSAEKPLVLDI